MNYTHLAQHERYPIHALKKADPRQYEIADLLSRSPATISRELARNSSQRGYCPQQARRLAEARTAHCRNGPRLSDEAWAQAKARLEQDHSPEQVAAKLPVSHETLYQRIDADKREGGHLWRHLRCQKQRRKRYGSGRSRRGRIPQRRPITQRPDSVQTRARVGHWEGDTIIGKGHQQAVVSLVERKSGYCLLAHVPRKTSGAVRQAVIQPLTPFKARASTLTFDNELEFADHVEMDQALGSTAYFADAYTSWQRGTNENTNGLVRQKLPKSRSFTTITRQEITMINRSCRWRRRRCTGRSRQGGPRHVARNRGTSGRW